MANDDDLWQETDEPEDDEDAEDPEVQQWIDDGDVTEQGVEIIRRIADNIGSYGVERIAATRPDK